MKVGMIAFLKSEDPRADREEWFPIMPADVPEGLKDPGVIGQLVEHNAVVQLPGAATWYRAELLDGSALVVQDQRKLALPH